MTPIVEVLMCFAGAILPVGGLTPAIQVFFCCESEIFHPFGVVFATLNRLLMAHLAKSIWAWITLLLTIDDVDCSRKWLGAISCQVSIVWLPVACHDVMHAWLRIWGRHIEPHGWREASESVRLELGRVFEKLWFGVVATVKGVGELAVVVVPADLQWAASIVLYVVYVWPLRIISPGVTLVWMMIQFFSVIETLAPPFILYLVTISMTRFLSCMGKESGQLLLACVLQSLVWSIGLIAEGRELGDTLNEGVIGVKVFIDVCKLLFPCRLWEYFLDQRNVLGLQVVIDLAVNGPWGRKPSLFVLIIGVRLAIFYTYLCCLIVKVMAGPVTIRFNTCLNLGCVLRGENERADLCWALHFCF